MKPHVDFYVVPNDVIRAQVAAGAHVNGRGAHLYLYKRRIRSGTKEHAGQCSSLPQWRDRFDVLAELIRMPSRS